VGAMVAMGGSKVGLGAVADSICWLDLKMEDR